MFSNGIQHAQSQDHSGGFDEQDALNSHQAVFNQGGTGGLTSGNIGTAAAMQTLKGMISGGGQSIYQCYYKLMYSGPE
jgi:hypothetical protein